MRAGFTIAELLVAGAVVAVLVALSAGALPALTRHGDRMDALAKTRSMGLAVLQYTTDHGGKLPPLFPGQVLEYEKGRGGRIVTECAAYLGLPASPDKYLAAGLMPRAYARRSSAANLAQLRVWVMNISVTNQGGTVNPFGTVTVPGQPPTGSLTLGALAGAGTAWMLSTADQTQPAVTDAPWKANTPTEPPLRDARAVFRFDGSADLVKIGR